MLEDIQQTLINNIIMFVNLELKQIIVQFWLSASFRLSSFFGGFLVGRV